MSDFQYFITVTGDCTSTNSGSINVEFNAGVPNYTAQWLTPNLGIDTNITATTRTSLSAGTYVLRVNDSSIPINNEFFLNVQVSSGCTLSYSKTDTTCNSDNGSIIVSTITPTSSYEYFLYKNGVLVQSSSTANNNITFNSLGPGLYDYDIIDIGGCSASLPTIEIQDSQNFDYDLYVVNDTQCGGPKGKVIVSGCTGKPPHTYLWNNGETTSSITGLTAGIYTVSVTDADGCVLNKSAEVINAAKPEVSFTSTVAPTCFNNDGSITIYITGGVEPFYYSASNGFSTFSYNRQFTLSNLVTGTYIINVTDSSLCQTSATTSIQSVNAFSVADLTVENSYCDANQGKVTISLELGSPPYKYTLIDPLGNQTVSTTNSNTQTFNNLSTGEYTLAVTDKSNCVYTETFNVIATNKFVVNLSTSGVTCGLDNGAVRVQQSQGGTPPYNYYIDDLLVLSNTFLTDYTFTDLAAGPHVLRLIDNTGCEKTNPFLIGNRCEPIEFTLYVESPSNVDPYAKINALITRAGTPPYEYYWEKKVDDVYVPYEFIGTNNNQIVGVTSGEYRLSLIDQCTCTQSSTVFSRVYTPHQVYDIFSICNGETELKNNFKYGLKELAYEGYKDTTQGEFACSLNNMSFYTIIKVDDSEYSMFFYSGKSLNDVPSDELWISSIETLLNEVSGIKDFNIDWKKNKITIESDCNQTPDLCNSIIDVSVRIEYDVECKEKPDTFQMYISEGQSSQNPYRVTFKTFDASDLLNLRPYYETEVDESGIEAITYYDGNKWTLDLTIDDGVIQNEYRDIYSLKNDDLAPIGDIWQITNEVDSRIVQKISTSSSPFVDPDLCITLTSGSNRYNLKLKTDGFVNNRLSWIVDERIIISNFNFKGALLYWDQQIFTWVFSKNDFIFFIYNEDTLKPITDDWENITFQYPNLQMLTRDGVCPPSICLGEVRGSQITRRTFNSYYNDQYGKYYYIDDSFRVIRWNGQKWEYLSGNVISTLSYNIDVPIGNSADWTKPPIAYANSIYTFEGVCPTN